MKNIVLFMLLVSLANSANLLTHNIYERTDRVDIMLSFDSPYEGKITQKRGENITTLTLNNLTHDELVEKSINSDILQAITIEPNKNSINIILKSKNPIAVIASKTTDGFGLRIRTKPIETTQLKPQATPIVTKTQLNTKSSESLVDGRYLGVILLLCVMVLFMLWIKKRVALKNESIKTRNSWLFKTDRKSSPDEEINVLNKKQIDNNNSVILLEFQDRIYLVMTGGSNVLLEKFSKEDIKSDSDFETAFEDNRKKLDEYLKIQKDEDTKDSYRSKLERY